MSLLTDICRRDLTVKAGKDLLLVEIHKIYNSYQGLELEEQESLKHSPYQIQDDSLDLIQNTEQKVVKVTDKQGKGKGKGKGKVKSPGNTKIIIIDKSLTREFLSDLFPLSDKVCLTTSKNYYLIAHLTQADLSLLSDFDLIKEELNIVNGSFVTLRNALKFCDKKIHVRDTMLLAPGGSKSLATIGKLYGSEYHKIEIAKEQISELRIERSLLNMPYGMP